MRRYLAALNRAYFSVHLEHAEALDPDGRLLAQWLSFGDLTSLYVASVQRDFGRDFSHWDSDPI